MAIRTDASTDGLSRTTNLPATNSYTIMGWFYIAVDLNTWSTFFYYAAATGAEHQLETTSDGVTIELWNGSTSDLGTALSVGTWYHMTMSSNGTTLSGYLNGVLDVSVAHSSPSASPTLRVSNSRANEPLNGRVAAIKVWDVALTAAEIQAEMQSVVPVRLADLNSWYPCFAGATERLADYSGNGRNWTAAGTLADEDGPPVDMGGWFPNITPVAAGGAAINFATIIAGSSSTPDTVALAVARALSTAIAGTSLTPDTVALAVARALSATIAGSSSTPDDVDLSVAARFAVTIAGTSSTPDDVDLSVARALAVTISGSSSTPDDVELTIPRLFAATIAGSSSTPDDVDLTIARLFATVISGSSSTPDDVELTMLLAFAATIAGTSSTPDDVELSVARALAATIAGVSVTPNTVTLLLSLGQTPYARHTARVAAQQRSTSVHDDRVADVPEQPRTLVV